MELFSTRARRPVVRSTHRAGTRGHGMDPLACFAEVFGDGFLIGRRARVDRTIQGHSLPFVHIVAWREGERWRHQGVRHGASA
jgi:hypothetical protein